ncbi:hypothetical protein NQ317_011885, partial [Molorchus minor]
MLHPHPSKGRTKRIELFTKTVRGQSNRCPKSSGQFPANHCQKYINCWNGIAIEQSCPDGLLFSEKGYCDYPDKVHCGQRSVGNAGIQFLPSIYQNPILSSPPASQTTPGSMPSSGSGIHTTQVLSGYINNPLTSSIYNMESVPTGLPGGQRDQMCLRVRGQFPSGACNKYVNCWDGTAVEQVCPEGFLFNSVKLYCDFPENVDCSGKSVVGIPPATSMTNHAESTTSSPSGYSSAAPTTPGGGPSPTVAVPPSSDDTILKRKCLKTRGVFPSTVCNRFVHCWDGGFEERECPEGFLFSTRGYCDSAENVDCSGRTPNSNKIEDSPNQECPLETGTFRDTNKCNAFYTCLFGKIVARYTCPEGLNFNDNIGVCDYANRVDCSKNKIHKVKGTGNDNSISSVNGSNNEKDCPVEFGTFRDIHNCSSYYTCAYRKIVAKYSCPTGFSFNDELGVCDYAERVDCTKPSKIFQVKPNGLPQLPNGTSGEMQSWNYVSPQPTMHRCMLVQSNRAEIVQCPAGLAYDSRMDKCILPHLAR